jgi:hemerythrin superfamily protein
VATTTAHKSATRKAPATKRPQSATNGRQRSSTRDAVAFLKADHREVEKLFKAFEKAGERAYRSKRKLVDDMTRSLSQHAAIEEQVFYPAVRSAVPEATGDVLEALEEHHIVKWVLSELEGMDPTDERFDAKVTVLMENVRHHVREEEGELFPEIRSEMDRKALVELGGKLQEAKEVAPTRPHPRAPDEPPGNVLVGTVTGVVDRALNAAKSKR